MCHTPITSFGDADDGWLSCGKQSVLTLIFTEEERPAYHKQSLVTCQNMLAAIGSCIKQVYLYLLLGHTLGHASPPTK